MSNNQTPKIEDLESKLNQSQQDVMLLQQALQAAATLKNKNK
jgi:hypothetical protein